MRAATAATTTSRVRAEQHKGSPAGDRLSLPGNNATPRRDWGSINCVICRSWEPELCCKCLVYNNFGTCVPLEQEQNEKVPVGVPEYPFVLQRLKSCKSLISFKHFGLLTTPKVPDNISKIRPPPQSWFDPPRYFSCPPRGSSMAGAGFIATACEATPRGLPQVVGGREPPERLGVRFSARSSAAGYMRPNSRGASEAASLSFHSAWMMALENSITRLTPREVRTSAISYCSGDSSLCRLANAGVYSYSYARPFCSA